MKKFFLATVMISSLAFANGFTDMGMSKDMHIMLSSDKVLTEGQNKIKVELNRNDQNGAIINAKDVRIKFFMPEMPGMPYMESKDICKKSSAHFECSVNFPMSGTWQYQLFIKDENNKNYKHRGSVNLGQSSMMHHNH